MIIQAVRQQPTVYLLILEVLPPSTMFPKHYTVIELKFLTVLFSLISSFFNILFCFALDLQHVLSKSTEHSSSKSNQREMYYFSC